MQLRPRQRTFDSRAAAKAAGATHYDTGKPCKHGHLSLRSTAIGACLACDVARQIAKRGALPTYACDVAKACYARHRAKYQAASREAYRRDSAAINLRVAKKRAANPGLFKQYRDRAYRKNPALYIAGAAERRALVARACPTWADRASIRLIYRQCREIVKRTGVDHHVDHVIPLRGKNVCGLHVPGNLQILPAVKNRAKGNRWSEDHAA